MYRFCTKCAISSDEECISNIIGMILSTALYRWWIYIKYKLHHDKCVQEIISLLDERAQQ